MKQIMKSLFSSFMTREDGNFATIFAITLVPLIGSVGMAIDYARVGNAKSQLQNAADTAALAGASLKASIEIEDDDVKAFANEYAALQVDNLNQTQEFRFSTSILDDGQIHVQGTGMVKNTLFSVLTGEENNLVVNAVASYELPSSAPAVDTEIVLAIDMTNSMNFGTTWDDAKRILADTMDAIEKNADVGQFHGAIVPFSDRVNIGSDAHRANWLTTSSTPAGWNGCVEPRETMVGSLKYAVDNDRPENSFRPSHPGYYMPTGMNTLGTGDAACPEPFTEPTTNMTSLKDAINALDAKSGTGRFDEGLAWSWRMLSKSWRGRWNQPAYPGEHGDTAKQIIFLSDGRTTINRREYEQQEPWGWNMGDDVMFGHMVNLCERIKADDIVISMIQLAGNSHASPYFQQCASPDNYFYVDSADDFVSAVSEIAENVNQVVRLTK